jgi:hypothetical protein
MRISLALALLVAIASSVTSGSEDLELRDLDVAGWNCLDRAEGTAKTTDGIERNRMKNRSPDNRTPRSVESLDVAAFLKKVGANDAYAQGKRRSGLTADQREQLDSYEKQIVSLTGWLVLAYAGPPETAIAEMPPFMTGTLRYSKTQAITHRKSAIRHQSFVRLHPGRSRLCIVKAFAFNRSLDFSRYKTSASKRQDTRHRRFA